MQAVILHSHMCIVPPDCDIQHTIYGLKIQEKSPEYADTCLFCFVYNRVHAVTASDGDIQLFELVKIYMYAHVQEHKYQLCWPVHAV
jgi:hypothetical protein